jgi:hypothetical protein
MHVVEGEGFGREIRLEDRVRSLAALVELVLVGIEDVRRSSTAARAKAASAYGSRTSA